MRVDMRDASWTKTPWSCAAGAKQYQYADPVSVWTPTFLAHERRSEIQLCFMLVVRAAA